MPLAINSRLELPDSDLELSYIRSPGPGGQNVNKVATAVQLRFDLAGNTTLSEPQKQRLRTLAGHRLNDDGTVLIVAREYRSQERNRAEALERLKALVLGALHVPKPRRATKPTRASKERRLQGKARDSQRKSMRGKVSRDD